MRRKESCLPLPLGEVTRRDGEGFCPSQAPPKAVPALPKGESQLGDVPRGQFRLSSQISRTAMSAGLTPEMRLAWPMDMGRISDSFCRASSRRP